MGGAYPGNYSGSDAENVAMWIEEVAGVDLSGQPLQAPSPLSLALSLSRALAGKLGRF